MISFEALDWYETSRGKVAVVACDRDRDRSRTGLIGPVCIDGAMYDCLAVEVYALATPLSAGERIGLLVKKTPEA